MKKTYVLILVLVFSTIIFASLYSLTNDKVEDGIIIININDVERTVRVCDLPLHPVEGLRKNGKGDEVKISASGIVLSALTDQPYSSINVTSLDGFSAQIAATEAGGAYLLLADDGTLRLTVFSDHDSKRSVKNVLRVDFN